MPEVAQRQQPDYLSPNKLPFTEEVYRSTVCTVSVMELCSWCDAAGNLRVGMLRKAQKTPKGDCFWVVQARLALNDLMEFTQSIPESLTVTRVKYTGQPLHWNVMEENPLNKKGRSRVMSVCPDPEFASWEILAHPKALTLDCFDMTVRDVAGCGNCPLKTFSLKSRPMNIVFDLQGAPFRAFEATPNTRAIFRYLLRYHAGKFDEQQQNFMERILPQKAVVRRLLRIEGADFLSFIQRLPGRKMAMFYNGPTESTQSGHFVNGVGYLQVFCWVPPWATQAMEHCTHVQIDASFKAAKPYVFYVPQAVIANRGLAYGLAIAPTEREDLYFHFHRLLKFQETGLPHPPALADLGTAISGFARESEVPLFMCHRHLLEAIGSASFAVSLFRPLLRALSEDEFLSYLPQFVNDIATFTNYGLISEDIIHKFERYLGCTFYRDGDQYTGDTTDVDRDEIVKWALFARGGVATCSNHAESFHKHLNQKTRANTCFMTKLTSIVECVKQNRLTINERIVSGIKDKQNKLKKRVQQRMLIENAQIEAREECQCKYHTRNQLLYQCDGFCYHTVLTNKTVPHCQACLMQEEKENIPTEDPVISYTEESWDFSQPRARKNAKRLIRKENDFLYIDSPLWKFLHSCSLLIEKSVAETLDILFDFLSQNHIDSERFYSFCAKELAELKAELVLSVVGKAPKSHP